MDVNIAHEVELVPDLGISADSRSIEPSVDRLGPRDEQQIEVEIERDRVVRAMNESDPPGLRLSYILSMVRSGSRMCSSALIVNATSNRPVDQAVLVVPAAGVL